MEVGHFVGSLLGEDGAIVGSAFGALLGALVGSLVTCLIGHDVGSLVSEDEGNIPLAAINLHQNF